MAVTEREKLMAAAVYEIRLLLSGYIGPKCEADPCVRLAAHLAYALHNEALSVVEGNGEFDLAAARKKILRAEQILGDTYADNGAHLRGTHR